ncbi:MAG: TolC family protein [Proteobacteria bacterium]|nr:TolC family protein [Pseudomonadota bacterium]
MPRSLWPLALAAALFVLHAQPATPSTSPDLTLAQALARAESGSPQLSAARLELAANEGSVVQAGVLPNPELGVELEDFQKATRTTTATLSIPLELGGKRAARVSAAERGRALAGAELESTRASVRAATIAAYFELLVAQERVQVAAATHEIATRATTSAQRRVQAGRISPVDATRAQVAQANAALALSEARAALEAARRQLALQWGADAADFARAAPANPAMPQRPGLDALLGRLDESPAMRASRLSLEHRRALVDVEVSKGTPDMSLVVGAKRDNELGRNQAVVGLNIPLPLFDRNQGNVQEANQRALKAEDEHRARQASLRHELRNASAQLDSARNTEQQLRTVVLPAAQQAQEAATVGFEAGKFNQLDVLDAQRTLLEARERLLDAQARAWQAASAIDRVLGDQ